MDSKEASSSSQEQEGCSFNWNVHKWDEAFSTNDLARQLAPWSIAVCTSQTNGRGRFNRKWFGEEGGLWISFTVPLHEDPAINWGHLPLLAGLAVLKTCEGLGLKHARLRWPNDILVGKSKLGGILVERPSHDMAVIGIGINIHNPIEKIAEQLQDPPVKLADLVSDCPSTDAVMILLGNQLENLFKTFAISGLDSILDHLTSAWKEQHRVSILLDDETIEGTFLGIDSEGNPILHCGDNEHTVVQVHLINRLIELS